MANEITAEMLAAKAAEMDGDADDANIWEVAAHDFMILTRALASLQAERPLKDAPERLRCWLSVAGVVTEIPAIGQEWEKHGALKAKGWFTPDTK